MKKFTEDLYPFCASEKQRQFLELKLAGASYRDIARTMGVHQRNAERLGERILRAAYRMGYDPDSDMTVAPQALPVSGTSTLYKNVDGDGVTTQKWVKTNKTAEQMVTDARELIAFLSEDVPRLPAMKKVFKPGPASDNLLNLHILTDYHLGMYAWGEETHGDNWSTDIAERFLQQWFAKAILEAPDAKIGFLMQLGDLLHYDSLIPVTPAHKHVLDADTRLRMVQRVAIRSLRRIIDMMLVKYEKVVILMVEGNHDESSSGWLTEMFSSFLEDEPRIEVITDPAPFGAYKFGEVMLGWTHGHKVNMDRVDKVLVGRFPKMFGNTLHRYAHIGHFHHRELKRDLKQENLMTVEMHTTIAAMDGHAANGGYGNARGADVITYHKEHGQVSRRTLTPEMVLA